MNPRYSIFHFSISLFCLSAMVFVTGCGGGAKEAANVVKGKITVKGTPCASGTVTFHGSKDVSGPIASGIYQIENPPLGQVKISVKALGGAGLVSGGKKLAGEAAKSATDKGQLLGGAGDAVAPNKKYESPDNGLTYEVKAGKQTHDIDLEP